ncbi:hypothetical protein [Saccharothrix yanglingensis]|uniref:hypothetical protein n=1 Tax=Saccharothrix yanglingensis TaxID=659496 RepID=UPI0027D24315|nr:hypothetical protein [Saccharothrix yanglingensis]
MDPFLLPRPGDPSSGCGSPPFGSATDEVTATPEQVLHDDIDRVFAILDVDGDGVVSRPSSARPTPRGG